MAEEPLYTVYLGQNGSSLVSILDRKACDDLYRAIYEEGIPVGVWLAFGSESTGFIVNPRRGGVILNMEPAKSFFHDGHGNLLGAEQLAAFQAQHGPNAQPPIITPKDQRQGKVIFPGWASDEMGYEADDDADEPGATHAPPPPPRAAAPPLPVEAPSHDVPPPGPPSGPNGADRDRPAPALIPDQPPA